jgi:GxxExxY protein
MMLGSPDEIATSGAVVDAAIEVHRALGPGLLESVYATCLADALVHRGCVVRREVECPVRFRGRVLDRAFRLDMIVDERVIVEVKAAREVTRVHSAQLLSYLRLTGCRVGLLLNFNVLLMKDAIARRYNLEADRSVLRRPSAAP